MRGLADAAYDVGEAVSDVVRLAGVDCLELTTDEPLDQALLRFTQLRKRRSQLASGATATFTHKRVG